MIPTSTGLYGVPVSEPVNQNSWVPGLTLRTSWVDRDERPPEKRITAETKTNLRRVARRRGATKTGDTEWRDWLRLGLPDDGMRWRVKGRETLG